MAGFTKGGVAVPVSTDAAAWTCFYGEQGASEATAAPKKFTASPLGQMPALNLASGANTLTLTMARGGILASTSPGSTTLTIPTFATLGYTRDSSNPVELVILLQRRGLGGLFVNPASGVTINWNDLDPQFLAQYHPVVALSTVGANLWAAN